MSNNYLEQRVNIQLSAKLEKYANKTFAMLRDFYNDKETSRTKLFDRYYKFRGSRKEKHDDWWRYYSFIRPLKGLKFSLFKQAVISENDENESDRWLHFGKWTESFRKKFYIKTVINKKIFIMMCKVWTGKE